MSQPPGIQRRTAITLLVATAFLWSLGGILIKWVDWPPLAIAGGRAAIAAMLIFAYLRRPRFTWSPAQIAGALAYTGTVILFVQATKMTTAANAILLQYTAPVYVALFGAWFLKEQTTFIDWVTIGAVFAGMGLFFLDEFSAQSWWGNVIAIASGVSFAWLALLLRKQKSSSPLESILLGNIITALLCLPFYSQALPSASILAGLLLLGVFQLGLSYILYSIAIRYVTALDAVLITVIEPILNPLWVLLLLGEQPGTWALVGGGIVLSAILLRSTLQEARAGA
ncbi:MAG: DMT family transporter [Acidobacteriota bacterium]